MAENLDIHRLPGCLAPHVDLPQVVPAVWLATFNGQLYLGLLNALVQNANL